MDRKSIAGYAMACRIMYDALAGNIDDEKLAHLEHDAMVNPQTGIVALHRYAIANRVLSDEDKRKIARALDMVDSDARGPLDEEERGRYVLDWWNPPLTDDEAVTVKEAAELIGISTAAVSAAAGRGDIRGEKFKGEWRLARESVADYKRRRESR